MSDPQEPSMQAQEEMLRAQAAEADEQGVSIDELQPSIGENSGAAADPVEDANEGNDTHNPSDDGNNDEDNPDTNSQGESASNSENDEDAQGAESSNQNTEGENGKSATPEDKAKTKAKKEEDRRDRSWRKLEEEKAQFLREKAEWEAKKLNAQAPSQNPAQNPNALAEAFDNLAKGFEEAGDFDKADEARQKAAAIRANQHQTSNQSVESQSNPQFKIAWNANMERAINDFPEMKDPASDFGKTVTSLLRAPDSASFFASRPDGVYIAAQLAKMKMSALRVPTLEKENAALKEENKKLRLGMSIPDTGASARGSEPKGLETMSLAQQEEYFRRQAEIEDASGAPVI